VNKDTLNSDKKYFTYFDVDRNGWCVYQVIESSMPKFKAKHIAGPFVNQWAAYDKISALNGSKSVIR